MPEVARRSLRLGENQEVVPTVRAEYWRNRLKRTSNLKMTCLQNNILKLANVQFKTYDIYIFIHKTNF